VCARAGRISSPAWEASAPAAATVDAVSKSRRENRIPLIVPPSLGVAASHPEQLAVARLDLLARPFDADGVLLHGLDVAERLAPGFALDQGMHRPQRAEIDDQLRAFGRKEVAWEQSRRVGVRRFLEESVRPDDE